MNSLAIRMQELQGLLRDPRELLRVLWMAVGVPAVVKKIRHAA